MINVENYLGLAYDLAIKSHQKYKGMQSFDDILQAAYLGMMRAANKFDESKGFKFSSYAVPWIIGEIKHCILDDTSRFRRKSTGYESIITTSLNKRMSENSNDEWVVILEDTSFSYDEVEDREMVRNILEKAELTEIQHEIIKLYFFDGLSQTEIADMHGKNQAYASRLIKKTLNQLRKVI